MPLYRHLTSAKPMFSTPLYSCSPTVSSFSQPGIHMARRCGSVRKSHTRWRGAGKVRMPESFIECAEKAGFVLRQTQHERLFYGILPAYPFALSLSKGERRL